MNNRFSFDRCDGYYRITGLPAPLEIGIAGKSANRTDYSADSDEIRVREKALVGALCGVDTKNILTLNQVHEDTIHDIDVYPDRDTPVFADGDGMLTALPGLCMVIRTADCLPVIAFDARRTVLGAAHAGWRGCRLNIAGKLVRTMKERYGSDTADIITFILPSIGPQSYAVNDDVAAHFPDSTLTVNGRIHVDLWDSIGRSLLHEGILPGNIFASGVCTRINHTDFFSHRYGDTGRNLNYCCINPCKKIPAKK